MVHSCNVLTKFPKFVTIVSLCHVIWYKNQSALSKDTETINREKGKEDADTEVGILI